MNDPYTWATQFGELFDRCARRFRQGDRRFENWLERADVEFLSSIGCRPREIFDFVEDHCGADGGEPSRETALLVTAVRREYFLSVQKGVPSGRMTPMGDLPPKPAQLEGIPWLPRIIAKAEAKLRGEMDPEFMYGCGGDCAFLARHHLHPADFLRVVWETGGDPQRILEFVRTGRRS